MRVKVSDNDRGASYLVRRAAELANKVEFSIGVPENAGDYPDGTPVATVALAHEFGLGVPQRSFIRGWFDGKGQGHFGRELARMAQGTLLHGVPLDAQIAAFGEKSVQEIRSRMDEGITPSLKEATVKHKRAAGSPTPETPLEDTHRLRNAVTWKVGGG
jgi:hypothetical protein